MRIAIVGSGISGLVCGWLLSRKHEVTLFEADSRLGGHTNTVDFEAFGKNWSADTGFMVFNDRTYPNFIRLLELLDVPSQPSDMSFSVVNEETGLEYQGSSLNGLFAQRRNLLRPSFLKMLCEILRFNALASGDDSASDPGETLGKFVERHKFSQELVQNYLLPMTAAIWSAPASRVLDFPADFLFRFYKNHGLLQLKNRPQWRTIPGGARNYIEAITKGWQDRVRLNCPVREIRRTGDTVAVAGDGFDTEEFEAVVLACHAPDSLAMLHAPSALEAEILSAFSYQENEAIMHTDLRQLSSSRRAWASWNYRVDSDDLRPPTVTYNLSRLQRLDTPQPVCVTLNPAFEISERHHLARMIYSHPLYSTAALDAQQRRDELHAEGKIFFCGAYWGNGFHEDGVNSALAVCERFGLSLKSAV